MQKYVQKFYDGLILLNNRKTIKNPDTNRFLELDIYLPDVKLAIEYNGSYWHSSDYSVIKDNYKKQYCKQNGIYLMTIADDKWRTDDNYKKLIKHIIKFRINQSCNKIQT